MSHVFVSYSTRNSEYAYKLADKLRTQGFDVWIDNAGILTARGDQPQLSAEEAYRAGELEATALQQLWRIWFSIYTWLICRDRRHSSRFSFVSWRWCVGGRPAAWDESW